MAFKRLLTMLAAGTVAMAICGPGQAQDVVDLVGTWKRSGDRVAIRLGEANEHSPEYQVPTVGKPADEWSIVIDKQEGRAFSGYTMSRKGGKEEIVGVIHNNGTELLISGDVSALFGEIKGETIEFCYLDLESDRAAVACVDAAKE